MEHVQQWRKSGATKRDELINTWLGTQWSITMGAASPIGEVWAIDAYGYVGEREREPAFEIRIDGDEYPLYIRAHFALFSLVK